MIWTIMHSWVYNFEVLMLRGLGVTQLGQKKIDIS